MQTFPFTNSHDFSKGRQAMGLVFSDMTEFAAYSKEHGCGEERHESNLSWYGYMDHAQAVQACVQGSLASVEKSDALMSKLADLTDISSLKLRWIDAMAGGFPNVPAAIAGSPLSMRTRVRDRSTYAPMAIVLDLTISAGIDLPTIEKRGACILTLARLLSAVRPVELYVCVATNGGNTGDGKPNGAIYQLIRIETAPLDLPRACFAMMHAAFPRRLGYANAREFGFTGQWPYQDKDRGRAALQRACLAYLPHARDVMAIPGLHLADETVNNPEQWLRNNIAKYAPQMAGE